SGSRKSIWKQELITWVGQFYFGDNVDKWIKFKLALTSLARRYDFSGFKQQAIKPPSKFNMNPCKLR
ncbi:hypothetical protein, partial [Vibrio sp. PID17_43]|uniref:hypothetical protein n=1 Tax=Vibrio sp. PID17_43 TaxID=1583451 RepID=UPI000C02384A